MMSMSPLSTFYLFPHSDDEFVPTYSPFWSNSTMSNTLPTVPDLVDSEPMILIKENSWSNRTVKLIGERPNL